MSAQRQEITTAILIAATDYRRRLTQAEGLVRKAVSRGGALNHDEWAVLADLVTAPPLREIDHPTPEATRARRRYAQHHQSEPGPLPPQDGTRRTGRDDQVFRA